MSTPNIEIELNDYPDAKSLKIQFGINIDKGPDVYILHQRKAHPSEKGVYVIFKADITDFSQVGNGCLYVGQGNLKERLSSHKNSQRFGKKEDGFIVVFYQIENDIDRKLVERILIKHHKPAYNKEGVSNTDRLRKESDFTRNLSETIQNVKEIFTGLRDFDGDLYEKKYDFTAVVVTHLQDGYSLEDIDIEIAKNQSGENGIEKLSEFLYK
ncbi:GIY-YIG nuclease family protein [Bacillus sp. BD59S]|uniref:GIY-YIG nuclease family protein n=1 Tax=Bacillus sp. BD59S TaxID=2499213 RepID=UPI00117EE9EF|nr:GIY-YIG nuclease family protein [Bacillus sp. BD59S]QDQ03755.1 hypothetical protein EKQ63_00850 [Bacillus sp. BD59S]